MNKEEMGREVTSLIEIHSKSSADAELVDSIYYTLELI